MQKLNTLRRLSVALRRASTEAVSKAPVSRETSLVDFLVTSKERLLSNSNSRAKSDDLTLVMGNEAGDLDSLASAIAFAWFRSNVLNKPSVPLIRTERDDFQLRPENVYALRLVGLDHANDQLLCLSDIPNPKSLPTTTFALVDHNRLDSAFGTGEDPARVTAVIDHHEDEGLYKDTADPRIVAPCGSCASHIAMQLPAEVPAEIANLLLCAIFVDTNGLKPGGKALQVDYDAVEKLLPLSSLSQTESDSMSFGSSLRKASEKRPSLHEHPIVKGNTRRLQELKFDVSNLSPSDLLRRDYKEMSLTLNWSTGSPTVKAGLSTVPLPLKSWGADGQLRREAESFMRQRNLTVLGVLTSFRGKKLGKSGKGKHKREMAWMIWNETQIDTEELTSRLWKGLEDSQELKVKGHKNFVIGEDGMKTRAYKQKNANATRKAVAPLMKAILESR